jgi:hypothetical protein
MTDDRVYIVDDNGHEIEVDIDVRDFFGNMTGVYIEGPQVGVDIVLSPEQVRQVKAAI